MYPIRLQHSEVSDQGLVSHNYNKYVPHNLGICAIPRLRIRVTQSRDCTAPVRNLEITQFLLKTQVIIQLSIVYKGKSCSSVVTFNVGHILKPPTPGLQEVSQLGETPFPLVWVRAQRDPRPAEGPRSRHHLLRELSTLLRRSHTVSLLHSYYCAISDCASS